MLILQNKVESYERLLEQLSLQVDGPTQLAIQKAIGKVFTKLCYLILHISYTDYNRR